jgi:flagellar biogenesis protein FliO
MPRLAPSQGKKVKVLETVHLGPRKMVHLLEIGGQQILIGSTPDKITKLADIMDIEIEKSFPLSRTRPAGETL